MKSLEVIGFAIFGLVVMLVSTAYAAEVSPLVNLNIDAIQAEMQTLQRVFTQVPNSKGKNTQQFDAAIERLRFRINSLNTSLKSSKQAPDATSKGLSDSASRMNAYFRSLEKARAQSDWRAVERDLDRLDATARELHSAALKIPGAPGTAERTAPKPPATGPSRSPSITVTPKPEPDSEPRTVGPYKTPIPVTRGPGPKGPDDPRFAVPPAPPVPPEDPPEPPPPDPDTSDDDPYGAARPAPIDGATGTGTSPMMRKPSRLPERTGEFTSKKPDHKESSGGAEYSHSGKSANKLQSATGMPRKNISQGVATFLTKIERANSIEDLKRSISEAGFSDQEIIQLNDSVKESRYLDKLKGIAQREITKQSVKQSKQKSTQKKNYIKETQFAAESHVQRLQKIKKEVSLLKRDIKTNGSNTFFEQTGESSVGSSLAQSNRLSPPREPSQDWKISSVSPSTVQVGRSVTITGNGFGDSEGLVVLRFRNITTGLTDLVYCDRIVSWSDNRIVLNIPREAARLAGDINTSGYIWIKVAGGETGPWHDITLTPDYSLIPPEITHVSHHDVIPDQPLLIQGRNFLSQQQGEVFLRVAGKDFPVQVISWEGKLIEVQIPPIQGLLRTPGSILVRNYAGYEALALVTFLPKMNGDEIMGPGDTGYFDPLDHSHSYIHVRCTPWFGGPTDDENPAWLLCVIGQKRENHFRINLFNEWTVKSARIELTDWQGWNGTHNCGAYFERGPVAGSNNIDVERVAWTNAYSRCTFQDYYKIEGPDGLSWIHDRYMPENACISDVYRQGETSFYADSPLRCQY